MSEVRSDAPVQRIRAVAGVVLGGLAMATVVVVLTETWPVPVVDAQSMRWMGAVSLTARLAGTFAILGSGVLAVLLAALAVKAMVGLVRR